MVFFYLSVGLALVFILHRALTFLSTAEPGRIRRIIGVFGIIALIGLIVLLLRFGLPHMAAILSFAAVVAPLVRRFMHVKSQFSRQSGTGPQPAGKGMSMAEACDILGVSPNASAKEVREAHRRLIQGTHPDKGGSEYLASKINEARDLLLSTKQDEHS